MSAAYTLAFILAVALAVIMLGLAWMFMDEARKLRSERDRARMALARTLRGWQYDANQGDGIDGDLLPEFYRSCSELGIKVNVLDDERYELTPTFTDYIQAHEGRTALTVLPPLEARDRTKGWG